MKLLGAVLLLLAAAPAAWAQRQVNRPTADSSAAQVMARAGRHSGAVWLRNILRQADTGYPQAALDDIADSLVGRAVNPRGVQANSEAHARAVDAVNALVLAGSNAPLKGRSYAGTFDRLVTVHRQAPSRDIRTRALAGMLVVSSAQSRAVDYLRRVAESDDPTASAAIQFLIAHANGGSWAAGSPPSEPERQRAIAALKAISSSRRVTDQRAVNILEIWLQRHRSLRPNEHR